MSASQREIQDVADELLELLQVRLDAGQIVIHYGEARVQKVEINTVHRPKKEQRYPHEGHNRPMPVRG